MTDLVAVTDPDPAPVPVLQVRGLRTEYRTSTADVVAVDRVDLAVGEGSTIGVVGESGCGKSTLARSIIGLIDPAYTVVSEGSVLLDGEEILGLPARRMRRIRGESIAMIFQNPQTALNPAYTIGSQIEEALRLHRQMTRPQRRARVVELLQQVGIPDPQRRIDDYPHQMSGGMQQRVSIAIALACGPRVLLADEPTTALDVTVQAQVLDLIKQINADTGMAVVLITHDMGVVAETCDIAVVMYSGVVVEEGPARTVFGAPQHPYTQGLVRSIPPVDHDVHRLPAIPGTIGAPQQPVTQCRFVDRCDRAFGRCREEEPPLVPVTDGSKVRCWLHVEEASDG